jgi:hypothetical protein
VRALVDVGCFLAELAMLALLAFSGWQLGDGGLIGIALAALYPALVIVVWSLFVARTAERRLRQPWRLLVQLVLIAGTTVAAAAAGAVVLAISFAAVACVSFGLSAVLGESRLAGHEEPTSPSSPSAPSAPST